MERPSNNSTQNQLETGTDKDLDQGGKKGKRKAVSYIMWFLIYMPPEHKVVQVTMLPTLHTYSIL